MDFGYLKQKRILLVDDEQELLDLVVSILNEDGFQNIRTAKTAGEAITISETYQPEFAILDVMLPGMNGFEIAKKARAGGIVTPILMLTAKGELDDKVNDLDSGADDYLTKPFQTKELLARLRALGRRPLNMADGALFYGDIKLETGTLTLSCVSNGQSVRLSEKEYHILEYLITNQGQILTREQLAVKIWGFENNAEYNNVEVYMSFTRKKLSFVKAKTEIKAVRGVGYKLRCEDV